MALPRLSLSADNMTSLFLLNRDADDMFSMFRGNNDFVITASLTEYAKCLKDFVIPNKLTGSFIYAFPHTRDTSLVLSNPCLLALSFMGDMAYALAKDACIASANLSALSLIEWTGLEYNAPTAFTSEQIKVAKTSLLTVLEQAGYPNGRHLKQAPYSKAVDTAVLAYSTALYISNAWSLQLDM